MAIRGQCGEEMREKAFIPFVDRKSAICNAIITSKNLQVATQSQLVGMDGDG